MGVACGRVSAIRHSMPSGEVQAADADTLSGDCGGGYVADGDEHAVD